MKSGCIGVETRQPPVLRRSVTRPAVKRGGSAVKRRRARPRAGRIHTELVGVNARGAGGCEVGVGACAVFRTVLCTGMIVPLATLPPYVDNMRGYESTRYTNAYINMYIYMYIYIT